MEFEIRNRKKQTKEIPKDSNLYYAPYQTGTRWEKSDSEKYFRFDSNGKPVKADLGSGINYYKGEDNTEIDEIIHIDGDAAEHVEIVCNFQEGIPLETGIVDQLHATEVIEHVPKFFEQAIMSEINRIMKIGGRFFGTTPSLLHSCKGLVDGTMNYETAMANMYGDQFYYPHCHYRLFHEESLIDFLHKWGFAGVDLSKSPGGKIPWWFVFECEKAKNI